MDIFHWTRLKFTSEIFGYGENGRQSSEILNDIDPITLMAQCIGEVVCIQPSSRSLGTASAATKIYMLPACPLQFFPFQALNFLCRNSVLGKREIQIIIALSLQLLREVISKEYFFLKMLTPFPLVLRFPMAESVRGSSDKTM